MRKSSFIIDNKFQELLCKQRHECRSKRQRLKTFGMDELYQDLYRQYLLFKPYLLSETKNVLDIGCGLGYIDVVLNDHIPDLNFYLFDSHSTYEGKTKVGNFYNDLDMTRKFLILNGVGKKNTFLIDATPTGTGQVENLAPDILKELPKMDLVVSKFAWGWHSRISKYIKEVSDVMNPGGILSIDVKGTLNDHYYGELEKVTSQGFEHIDSVQDQEGKVVLTARKL